MHRYMHNRFVSSSHSVVPRGAGSRMRESREKVVQRYLGLDHRTIGVALQPVAAYERRHKSLFGFGRRPEKFHAAVQLSAFLGAHGVFFVGELHFADVYDAVGSVDEHVDLRILDVCRVRFAAPGIDICKNPGYAERPFYLRNVPEAYSFKGESAPCVYGWLFVGVRPEAFVGSLAGSKKLEMEKHEVVDKLVDCSSLYGAEVVVSAYETALLEFSEISADFASAWRRHLCKKLVAGQSPVLGGKHCHDIHISGIVFEQRSEDFVEFGLEFCVLCKEKGVKVLCNAEFGSKQTPVVCHAAKRHIAFHQLPPVKCKMFPCRVFFAFLQRERSDGEWLGHTIVEPAPAVENLVHDPRCRGSADDEQYVFAKRRPSIPEMLERRHKSRFRRIKPRNFVKKHNLLAGCGAFEHLSQFEKGLSPVREPRATVVAVDAKRLPEEVKLFAHSGVLDTRMLKRIPPAEHFVDEKRLSHAATTIESYEFGLLGSEGLLKPFDFYCSSNHLSSPCAEHYTTFMTYEQVCRQNRVISSRKSVAQGLMRRNGAKSSCISFSPVLRTIGGFGAQQK